MNERLRNLLNFKLINQSSKYFNKNISQFKQFYIIANLVSLLIASTSPQSTKSLNIFLKYPFWLIQGNILASILLFIHLQIRKSNYSILVKIALPAILGAFIFSFPAYILDLFFEVNDNEYYDSFLKEYLDEFSAVFFPVIVFWATSNLVLYLTDNNAYIKTFLNHKKANDSLKLMDAINKVKDDIVAISSQKQYVKIYTESDESMHLCSMKDIVSSLPEDLGIMVHRSHWVSKNYFKKIKKSKDQNIFCEVSTGMQFPVSRRKKTEVVKFFSK